MSCYKNHLYVQQEWVNAQFLASSKVQTPDPRQEDPPKGQRLVIAWDFPRSLFARDLHILTDVRFWDYTERKIEVPVERKRDVIAFFFPDQKILTYRVQVLSCEEVVEVWEHPFWTRWYDLDSANKRSSSVSSQPMQLSVMETP